MSADQLIVLGMHRSGTSGVTRLLNLAGAWFGDEAIATETNEENPRGFWERRDVRQVCDGLLHAGGFDWWDLADFSPGAIDPEARQQWLDAFADVLTEMNQHRPWVIKEPRLCVLFPLIRPLLSAPVCVHVTREPLEVAHSVQRRNDLPIRTGLALWELHNVHAFRASLGLPRVLVRYDDLIVEPVATMGRLLADLAELGVEGLHPVAAADIESFIDPALHRNRRQSSNRPGRLNQQQAELAAAIDDGSILEWTDLGQISVAAEDDLSLIRRDQDRAEISAARERELERRQRELAELEARHVDLESRRVKLRADLSAAERATASERRHRERDVAAAQKETAAAERYRDTELARRRELGRQADLALKAADTQLERFNRSNLGRVARLLQKTRQTLTPGSTATDAGPVDHVRRDLTERRADLALLTAQDPAPGGGVGGSYPSGHHLVRRTRPRRPRSDRPSVAVISWDVGHNPLGRANILAEVLARRFDVELWGAQFDRYGSQVWAPLRDTHTPINVFPGSTFPSHLATTADVAGQIDADAIWVSKPRLPGYLLAAMAKQRRDRPLVLDVDDHELAFFDEDSGLDAEAVLDLPRDDLQWPFERAWTRLTDRYIDAADQVTVSNLTLQERYGGLIVPHARDEQLFDPARFDRDELRHALGVAPEDRLLLFGGTPRIHKGIVEVLEALERLGDDRYRVAVFGTREFDELRGRIGDLARWAKVLPAQPFSELPALVAAADLTCVLQDPSHPVSRYQMPAKISDALAMAVPCLVAATPPLAPLIEAGVLLTVDAGETLESRIARAFDDPDDSRRRAERGRELFLREYSYAAVGDVVGPMFERLLTDPPGPSERLSELGETVVRAFDDTPASIEVRPLAVRLPRRSRADSPPVEPGARYDVAMFWKQNDSGIYGRRQDMFLAELARSDRVGTIVHFDNPVSPEALLALYRGARGTRSDQGRWVSTETAARVLGRRHDPDVHRHTFLFGARWSRRLGRPSRRDYVDHVVATLARHGLGTRPLIVWGYPSNDDLPQLIDVLDPAIVLTDVVDDNRTWHEPGSDRYAHIEHNYREVLARSDVTIANCAPVATSMRQFTERVEVVANGLELPTGAAVGPRPAVLAGLTGPIIAYVGNLSSRLDLDLIEALVTARPDWNFVFVGSAHLDRSILALDRLANVSFPGVMRHRDVRTFLAHVDVALIPHVDDEMTRSMNPLKAFVYAAAGVPTVATPVANLADFGALLTVATDAPGFEQAIERYLAAGKPPVDLELLRPHSWQERVARVFELIDAATSGGNATSDGVEGPSERSG